MSIVFSQPMSVVKFYATTLSPAGASFDILDPINGDTLFVPIPIVGGGDPFGAGGTFSYTGHIVGINAWTIPGGAVSLNSLGFSPIPIPAA